MLFGMNEAMERSRRFWDLNRGEWVPLTRGGYRCCRCQVSFTLEKEASPEESSTCKLPQVTVKAEVTPFQKTERRSGRIKQFTTEMRGSRFESVYLTCKCMHKEVSSPE
ncbi:unnamed protein product [Hydatigera taeniaeformis]|uniref:Protein yippee-like n=1 Tax=Hydatigena taeniaeformis TaxID=6205 RepID=A0A0R3X5D2_HYDTA|nr:unnamed protein product [Hydatigera taeniaeformis]